MTLIEAVNSVLVRLREEEVSSYKESKYAKMVREFINDALIHVENSWDWSMLRASVQVNVVPDIFSYVMPYVYANSEINKVICQECNTYLEYRNGDWFSDRYLNSDSVEVGSPRYYTINGTDATGNTVIDIYPKPDTTYTLYVETVKRTQRLQYDNEQITVPYHPVVMLATAFAIRERGEVGSDTVNEMLIAAKNSLSDWIAIDAERNKDELVWRSV